VLAPPCTIIIVWSFTMRSNSFELHVDCKIYFCHCEEEPSADEAISYFLVIVCEIASPLCGSQ
jgi:hypothetical protein